MLFWRAQGPISLCGGLLLEKETCLEVSPLFSFLAHTLQLSVNYFSSLLSGPILPKAGWGGR